MMLNTRSLGFYGSYTTYYQKQTLLSFFHRDIVSVIIPKSDVLRKTDWFKLKRSVCLPPTSQAQKVMRKFSCYILTYFLFEAVSQLIFAFEMSFKRRHIHQR